MSNTALHNAIAFSQAARGLNGTAEMLELQIDQQLADTCPEKADLLLHVRDITDLIKTMVDRAEAHKAAAREPQK